MYHNDPPDVGDFKKRSEGWQNCKMGTVYWVSREQLYILYNRLQSGLVSSLANACKNNLLCHTPSNVAEKQDAKTQPFPTGSSPCLIPSAEGVRKSENISAQGGLSQLCLPVGALSAGGTTRPEVSLTGAFPFPLPFPPLLLSSSESHSSSKLLDPLSTLHL